MDRAEQPDGEQRLPSATQPMDDHALLRAFLDAGDVANAAKIQRRIDAAKAHRDALPPPAMPSEPPAGE